MLDSHVFVCVAVFSAAGDPEMRSASNPHNHGSCLHLSLVLLASGLMLQACEKGNNPPPATPEKAATSTPQSTPTEEADSPRRSKPGGSNAGNLLDANVRPTQGVQIAELPPIRMEPSVLDFGFITPNAKVDGSVKLKNVSSKPIKILAVQPTCKCTTLNNLAGTEIPPGGAVELVAAMDGGPNPGPKTAAVKVLVEGFARPVEVDLKAEISLPIRAIPPYINAVRDQNKKGRIVIESITGKPFRICSIHGKKPNLLNYDPSSDEPRTKYIFSYDLAEIDAPYPRYLVVVTDDPDVPVVDIYLRHETTMPNVNRNMRVAQGFRHPFGRIDKGGSKEIEIAFQSMREPIATVISSTPEARVELKGSRTETVGEDVHTHYTIEIIPAKDFEGVLYFPITFLTNSGDSVDVPVFGIVVPEGADCPKLAPDVVPLQSPPTPAG